MPRRHFFVCITKQKWMTKRASAGATGKRGLRFEEAGDKEIVGVFRFEKHLNYETRR